MLNLSRQEDMLTQGQPPAERVLANPNAQTEEPVAPSSGEAAAGASQAPAGAGAPPAAAPDVQLIARHVYELMRQDLLILHERRGLQNSSRPGR
jgi:hypothetical protein